MSTIEIIQELGDVAVKKYNALLTKQSEEDSKINTVLYMYKKLLTRMSKFNKANNLPNVDNDNQLKSLK